MTRMREMVQCGCAGGCAVGVPAMLVAVSVVAASPALARRTTVTRDGFTSVQVNVDAQGENIPGDAANEPSIAIVAPAPNGVAIGWRQFDTITDSFRQAGRGFSNDGGRSWTFPEVIEPGVFRSDPVLGYTAEGRIYYSSLTTGFSVQFFPSDDGGETYGSPVQAFGGDKQWFTVDRTGGPGHGNIYMAWNTAAGCCGTRIFNRSIDGGKTFSDPITLPGNPIFGMVDHGPNGEAYVVGRATSPTAISPYMFLRSSNAWDPDVTPTFDVISGLPFNGSFTFGGARPNPAGLLGQFNVAADRSDGPTQGNIYALASINPPGPDPIDIQFIRSTDGGRTWSTPVTINDDPSGTNAWQWFGTMSVGPTGRIDIVWNDTRNDAAPSTPTTSEMVYAFSDDAGETWSTNTPITPAWNHFVGFPQQNKIGDYYHMISDATGAHLAFAATFNGEQDVYYMRIGPYDCNGNAIPDEDDIAGGFSFDCNANGTPDECEIASGVLTDADGDGIADECACAIADITGDGAVTTSDLTTLLGNFGESVSPLMDGDLTGDGLVTTTDLTRLLGSFGQVCM